MEALADYLTRQREAVTQTWLHLVQTSPDLTTPDTLPVPQLLDHLPNLFDDMLDCVRGVAAPADADPTARAHGRHRWEQNFRLDEVLRELLFLRRIVATEVNAYLAEHREEISEGSEEPMRKRVELFFEEAIVRSTEQFSAQLKAQNERDRSLLTALHQTAQDAAEQLQSVDSARLRLLRVITHEIRNLLNSAMLTSAGLPNEPDPAWRDELHRMLGRSLTQMTALVNQLLDMAPLLSGREPIQLTALDLNFYVRQLGPLFEPLATAKGLGFEITLEPGFTHVMTDEAKLLRIVTNLIQNAIKYTDEGRVEVRFTPKSGGWFEIAVADTGTGIPPEHRERIFEEFHRVPGTSDKQGTGLGLAIVRQLVELLGGTIRLESAVGAGSTFYLTLPNREMSASA